MDERNAIRHPPPPRTQVRGGRWAVALAALLLFAGAAAPSTSAAAQDQPFAEALRALATTNFKAKETAIARLSTQRHPNTRAVMEALLNDRLYYRKEDLQVAVVAEQGDPPALLDPETLTPIPAQIEAFSRITTNNRLRRNLKGALAAYDLADDDRAVRLRAVNELLRSLDEDNVALLRSRADAERDPEISKAIATGLALSELASEDADVRLSAAERLEGSLLPSVYNRLQSLLQRNDAGEYAEPDARVREAARLAVAHIDSRRALYRSVETLFFGVSLGSVLVLAAIGLAITFGVMGVINMAHGELIMLGAYTTYVLQQLMPNHIGASVVLAVPLAFVISGFVGVIIERTVVRRLYGRPLETLLATFGVSLVLQQIVRDVFTANNRPVETPSWMSGSMQINEALSITYNRLYVVVFTALVFAGLLLILKRTTLGLKVRAVAQNRAMAKAMGVRTEWVDALTFGLGAGVAGVAGVALSQLTNVGPNLGQAYIIDSFMVVVFGGVGNLWGALIGGLSLGVVNQTLEPYAGAVLAKIVVLIGLILFIQRRPRGLFPQKGRAVES